MSEEVQATPTGLDRRQFIKSSAVVGGLVWAAPAMSTFGARAFAGSPDRDMCPTGDGQPSDLVWEYRPDLLANDPQECATGDQPLTSNDVFCTYDGDVDARFDLVTVKYSGTPPQDQVFQNVKPTDTISVPGKAGAKVVLVVEDAGGNEIHRVGIHTSCSFDLAIGDRFGAFVLIDGTASTGT